MNLSISILATPENINNDGDIFGGWLLSQMDLAGIIECKKFQNSRFVTIAIDKMKFKKHVSKGDLVKIYTRIEKIGRTSITINIKAFVDRFENGEIEVTDGFFTYVKIDSKRVPSNL
jgi:acyl-CoA thioesterase YciA